jgi:NADPH-dependent ferric siderophore reductase
VSDSVSSAPDAASFNTLLNSPQHRAGLNDLHLEVTSVTRRHPWLARVSGVVPGMADTDPSVWSHPNLALRLAIPDATDALGPMIGQAGVCRRVYTVAAVDVASSTLDIDIVVHGESSPMMRWLAGLEPGDRVDFAGPRPHAAPTDATGRIVLLADGSAYPAASAITRALPGVATVILALPEEDPQVSDCADYAADFPGAELRFAASSPTPLSDAFADLDVTATDTVWAAGEREDIRAVRARCLRDLVLPKPQVQVFGYWRHGKTGTDADMARLTGIAALRDQGRELEDDFEIEI